MSNSWTAIKKGHVGTAEAHCVWEVFEDNHWSCWLGGFNSPFASGEAPSLAEAEAKAKSAIETKIASVRQAKL